MRILVGLYIIAVLSLTPWSVKAGQDRICANAAVHAEKTHRTPTNLLYAISLKETGRWHDVRKESYSWPWTVTSGGEGRHFPSVYAAMAEVRRLLAEGITNIDVGCMQINLRYHGDAFDSLADAFDPTKNAEYGGRFLTTLKQRHGSWKAAVAHYHSNNPARGKKYRHAVSALQQQIYKGVAVTLPDPSNDSLELAARNAERAERLTRSASERRADHDRAQMLRETLAEQQRETARAAAMRLKNEFNTRKARLLAEWQERKKQRSIRN